MGTLKWLSSGIAQKIVFSTLIVPVYLAVIELALDDMLLGWNEWRRSRGEAPFKSWLWVTDEDFAKIPDIHKRGFYAQIQLFTNHYKDKAWLFGSHLDKINSWSLVAKPIKFLTWDLFEEALNGKVTLKKIQKASEGVKQDTTTNRNYLYDTLQKNPKNAKTADSLNLNLKALDLSTTQLDSLKKQITNLDGN
jgi:hypothetical protein